MKFSEMLNMLKTTSSSAVITVMEVYGIVVAGVINSSDPVEDALGEVTMEFLSRFDEVGVVWGFNVAGL